MTGNKEINKLKPSAGPRSLLVSSLASVPTQRESPPVPILPTNTTSPVPAAQDPEKMATEHHSTNDVRYALRSFAHDTWEQHAKDVDDSHKWLQTFIHTVTRAGAQRTKGSRSVSLFRCLRGALPRERDDD
jgi:hypothetical protein